MSNSERLERAEEENFRISEAIDCLNGVREAEEIIEMLNSRMIVLGLEKEECHRLVEREDEMEEAAMKREYWKSVI